MQGRTWWTGLLGTAALLSLTVGEQYRTVSAQTPDAGARQSWNFIDRVSLPVDQQDGMTRQVVERLATGVVKTVADARFRPFGPKTGSVGGRFLSADELPHVTGLFFAQTGVLNLDGLAQRTRDLVWEVTVVAGADIRSLFWISARTGVVAQVFPKD